MYMSTLEIDLLLHIMFHANTECFLVPNNHIGVIWKDLGPKPLDD